MQYIPEIISFIIGAIGGSFLTLSISKKSASKGGTVVDQSNANSGGGDVVGGNKTEHK